jgi:UDP-GlcNAc:undecaprenyl-phosphate/decaprenyl-phosphate GlcNAc-1-phosphate transferase
VLDYLVVFGVSGAAAFAATPLVRRFAVRTGAIDRPSDRKVHPIPTPTLGGIAIYIGVVIGMGVSRVLPFFSQLHHSSSEPVAALLAGLVILLIGVFDDVRGTSPGVKAAGQVLAAGILVLLGVQLLYFWFPGQGILSLGSDIGVPLTVLWVVAMVNAVNLIDGLDGLAAGVVAIAAIAFFAYIYQTPGGSLYGNASTAALLSAIVAGACLGFLPWNFNPAKIFMGDSGAMLLGLLLATATISGVGRTDTAPTGGDLAAFAIPIIIPVIVLALPFLDVMFAIIRRIRRGRPVTSPDKEHIHHRLMDIGHSHRGAVLMMYLWSALISLAALAVALINGRLVVGAILVSTAIILAATSLPGIRRRGRSPAPAPPASEPDVNPIKGPEAPLP